MLTMLISGVVSAQLDGDPEVVFDFECESFECGDLTFPDDTRFEVTSPNNQDPDLFFVARVQTIASGKRFWIGANLAAARRYYSEPSLTASNTTNGTDYFSPSGFRIDVGRARFNNMRTTY